jgi:hypothetical protein
MSGVEIARKFAELVLEERELKEVLKRIEEEKRKLAAKVEEFLLESGLKNLPFEDLGITVYTQDRMWATPKEGVPRDEILSVLEGCGWAEAINYNASTLSSLVRECIREEQQIPSELERLLEVKTRTDVRGKATV